MVVIKCVQTPGCLTADGDLRLAVDDNAQILRKRPVTSRRRVARSTKILLR
jgi:hypothetical protein